MFDDNTMVILQKPVNDPDAIQILLEDYYENSMNTVVVLQQEYMSI